MDKIINIKFPFKNNVKGFFLGTNLTTSEAIKSDLLHLIFTQKGQRLYSPDFGTNLPQYLFEPNDNILLSDIKREINDAVGKYIPDLVVTNLEISGEDKKVLVKISYDVTDGVLKMSDEITVEV